eukprot:CAMPEP_0178489092 /NCGR_PEP_ID=MMETSP0696-20121128/10197_1 /TAXON_ID=265572 /ORGANISM="Extubocellulus spinifer, Strain CCMP396" /LENGTH=599 /DNA_ID=CAMNT_0020116881 /DNA_START=103 /DNA_END=1902 /DNA_ORIENTATION=+
MIRANTSTCACTGSRKAAGCGYLTILSSALVLVLIFFAKQIESFQPTTRNDGRRASTTTTTTTSSTSSQLFSSPDKIAHVTFVSGSAETGYGQTSPEPNPTWAQVCNQLALRLPHFAGTTSDGSSDIIQTRSIPATELNAEDLKGQDVVVALGVCTSEEETRLGEAIETTSDALVAVLADPTCAAATLSRQKAGKYVRSSPLADLLAALIPWSATATGRRVLSKTDTLLARKSSEDYIFAVLFAIHGLGIATIDAVKSDLSPSWEKGPIRNAKEFAKMAECCQPQIIAAMSDPQTKRAIDLLDEVDLRDQVGSYRVIVSNETPELEEFTLCILQQNDCFGCDAPILDRPKVPLLKEWRGKSLDFDAAKQILMGHLDHPDASDCSQRKDWSWRIVVGANPAYDAFPLQHQIFYPSGKGKSMWYDPVFCVETLDDERIWCKRHYRVTPRRHWSADEEGAEKGPTPGAWTLNTLDNGMVSEEKWTTVDAADDLSWAVLHYSGAARRAGQSYVGALLCTPDGQWPADCRSGEGLERIRAAFRSCDLEFWELFGASTEKSYMWADTYTSWKKNNPPPLDRIGDISITAWRKKELEKAFAEKQKA